MKKDDLIEIRWSGRGGQGAVTAAKMFAESALLEGKFIQAFPEFGPERMGAPVKSFTRISSKPITIHCQITNPDISALFDHTLIDVVDIAEGMDSSGVIIVNTKDSPAQLRQKMGLKGKRLFTIDASAIAVSKFGRNLPGAPMMAAVIKATNILKLESVIRVFQQEYAHKFKDELIKANIEAMRAAYDETKSESG